ncbi:MAG: hypothetical protein IIC91_12300 [Chloroflexi bacterium]|nr:hypothetical protein [Chloroflexota bacterium]
MRLLRTHLTNAAHAGAPSTTRTRRTSRRGLLGIAIIIAVAAVVTSYVSFIGSDGEANASAELAALREQASPLLIYSEFGQLADTIWAADPNDPTDRAYVTTVEHSPGSGISASVSPDGAHLAYVVLPPGAGWFDSAQLWALEIESGAATLLAEHVGLRTTPVWTPAGDAVVVLRPAGGDSVQLLLVDLAGGTSLLAEDQAGLYPIGVTPDGAWLYFASLSERGTDLQRVAISGGSPQVLAHLSDGYSRDWHLAPDGSGVAYLGQTSSSSISFDARVYDVASGAVQGAVAGLSGPQFNPIWDPAGGLTVGRAPSGEAAGSLVHVSANGSSDAAVALAGPAAGFPAIGFYVPLWWSPDGAHLVVRSFEGSSTANPGPSYVIVMGPAGDRQQLSPLSDVLVIGWLE